MSLETLGGVGLGFYYSIFCQDRSAFTKWTSAERGSSINAAVKTRFECDLTEINVNSGDADRATDTADYIEPCGSERSVRGYALSITTKENLAEFAGEVGANTLLRHGRHLATFKIVFNFPPIECKEKGKTQCTPEAIRLSRSSVK